MHSLSGMVRPVRQALTWYMYGFLLLAWGLTLARELGYLGRALYPLTRVAGLAVLGGIPFFVLALALALWPRRASRVPEARAAETDVLAAD